MMVPVVVVLLCILLIPFSTSAAAADSSTGNIITLPGCPASCGDIRIPYPFGFKPGCFRSGYQLTCTHGKLFLGGDHNGTLVEINDFNDALSDTIPGNGYCSVSIINSSREYKIRLERLHCGDGRATGKAFLTTSGYYEFSKEDLISSDLIGGRPVVPLSLDWVIKDSSSCIEAKRNTSTYACRSDNSYCRNRSIGGDNSIKGYLCYCLSWHETNTTWDGNPYISGGCQASTCINSEGTFDCLPSSGSSGFKRGILIGVMVAIGFPLIILSIIFLYRRWKKRSLKRVREKHFHKNRGLLLQQLISSDNDIAERTRIFSFDELAKATDKFDEARVLGRGGHGTVFKGILSNQRVVAIKKSKINVQIEIDQFLNEVVILSQINHRNIVKLFGCCLETEVPLLVYEFVSNGTLSDHLHHPDRRYSLSWEDRLNIARDVSGALAYLHSAASISIFHRDVKSANILLDDYCTAKVSDFGASRSIPLDMTHVVTLVQGTFGYLDPEYYHTGQLTEKSDVYSFGVILVELLTGEKPISVTRPEEERNLCTHFLSAFRDGRLPQIVEARVMEEATGEEIDTICSLAETCLRLSGEDRPTMKRVEVSLEGLRRNKTRKRHPRKELKDNESASLLPSTAQYDNYPEPARPKEIPSGSNFEEQSMLSITLPR